MSFFKRAAIIAVSATILISSGVYAEETNVRSSETVNVTTDISAPETNAKSAILINSDNGRILYSKNEHSKMYPASMTKILTAMVVLDHMEPDETIKVDYSVNEVPADSSRAGVVPGEVLTVENVIRGLIIPSGNDIANAAASAVAKKELGNNDLTYNEAEAYFVGLMNKKAEDIGCRESHFANPHGYHNDNHYTTAYDMSLIAKEAMQYEIIRNVSKETKFEGNGAGNQKYNVEGKTNSYTWYSHNELITNSANHYKFATGIKTGFTDQAGDCLAASATNDNENLIAIIMNSEDPGRWNDAAKLFDWAFDKYDMIEYCQSGIAATATLSGHNRLKGDTVELIIKEPLSYYMTAEEAAAVETNIIYSNGGETLQAPVEKDAEVATLQFILNGDVIGETKAFTANEVKKANIFNISIYYLKTFFLKITSKENIKYTVAVIIVLAIILFIKRLRYKRKQRYKVKGNYKRRPDIYDTSRIDNRKKKRKNINNDKYNKYR